MKLSCSHTLSSRSKPIPLDHQHVAESDSVNKGEWYKIIPRFSDANIYQTWDYDAVRCGEKNVSHLVLRAQDGIVAAAQLRIVRIPILGVGAAYVRWGPFWQRRNQQTPDPAIFNLALRAMRNEYVCRRGLILRIFPILFDDGYCSYGDVLRQEGYIPVYGEARDRTLIVDITPQIDVLRKKLDQKWRNCLNKAERNGLEVIEGTDDALFAEFIGIYHSLLERKKFQEPNDINEFRMIQRNLPSDYKMRIFICRSSGTNSAGIICATIGDTGVYLFGATNEQGMTDKGSYLLQWKAIEWMKANGCRSYNLNGINPSTNPGSYHFKAGLSGKNGKDVHYIGRFDCYPGPTAAKLARAADAVLPRIKQMRNRLVAAK